VYIVSSKFGVPMALHLSREHTASTPPGKSCHIGRQTFMYKLAAFILNFDSIFVNVKLIFYELFPSFYFLFNLFPTFYEMDKYFQAGDTQGDGKLVYVGGAAT
jgi:hypothetical protein